MKVSKSIGLVSLGAVLAVALMGCSNDDASEDVGGGAAPTGAGASAEPAGSGPDNTAPQAECDLPDGLLAGLNQQRQLVLTVALANGENLDNIQAVNPLEPATFRSVADVLDGLDLGGVAVLPQFDAPDDVVTDLRRTADLLEAALDAGTNTADPAWQEFTDFYTQEFFTRHYTSVNYYLTEAGCQ